MQTKFEELKFFCLGRKTFRFSGVNQFFGQPSGSLNSYTTYLNYLVRAGYLEKTNHVYSIPDRERLKNCELADVLVRNKLKRAMRDYEELRESNENLREHRSELAVENIRLKQSIEHYEERSKQDAEVKNQLRATVETWVSNHKQANARADELSIRLREINGRWYVRLANGLRKLAAYVMNKEPKENT